MAVSRKRRPSPLLGAVANSIGEATNSLVTPASRFAHTFEAPLDRVLPDPDQPRKNFDPEGLASLASTMSDQGQLQPILLRRDPERPADWVIVAGERRWRAAKLLRWTSILAIEWKKQDGAGALALLENLQRIDLTPVEEARGIQRLLESQGWTQTRVAEVLGRTKGEISASLRMLTLPPSFVMDLENGKLDLPRNILVELARLPAGRMRDALIANAYAGRITVRALRAAKMAHEAPAEADEPSSRTVRKSPKPVVLYRFDKWLQDLVARKRAPSKLERERLVEVQVRIAQILSQQD